MSWLIGILGAVAAVIYGMYQLGPGINKRRQQKKDDDWMKKWRALQGGGKKK